MAMGLSGVNISDDMLKCDPEINDFEAA